MARLKGSPKPSMRETKTIEDDIEFYKELKEQYEIANMT